MGCGICCDDRKHRVLNNRIPLLTPVMLENTYGVSMYTLLNNLVRKTRAMAVDPVAIYRRHLAMISLQAPRVHAEALRGNWPCFNGCLIEAFFTPQLLMWKGLESSIERSNVLRSGFSPFVPCGANKECTLYIIDLPRLGMRLTKWDHYIYIKQTRRIFRSDILLSSRTKSSNVEPYLDMHARTGRNCRESEVCRYRVAHK